MNVFNWFNSQEPVRTTQEVAREAALNHKFLCAQAIIALYKSPENFLIGALFGSLLSVYTQRLPSEENSPLQERAISFMTPLGDPVATMSGFNPNPTITTSSNLYAMEPLLSTAMLFPSESISNMDCLWIGFKVGFIASQILYPTL